MGAAMRSTAGLRYRSVAIGDAGRPDRGTFLAIDSMGCKLLRGREMKERGKHMFILAFGSCMTGGNDRSGEAIR